MIDGLASVIAMATRHNTDPDYADWPRQVPHIAVIAGAGEPKVFAFNVLEGEDARGRLQAICQWARYRRAEVRVAEL